MPSARFTNALLGTPVGRIVAVNVLAGLRLGLYDLDGLCPVLAAWDAIVTREGYTDEEVPAALVKLKEPSADSGVPNMHVFCRLPLSEADRGIMATVRQSHVLEACFHKDDIQESRTRGIDLKARPGTASYRRSLQVAEASGPEDLPELRLDSGKSLTNPKLGERAILWYTKLESLEGIIAGCASVEHWADTTRDRLGLIHFGTGQSIAAVELPSRITDDRRDCGRPTFVEAGLHSRFCCGLGPASPAPWGTAVDLGALAKSPNGEAAGLSERVCGRVPNAPAYGPEETRLRLRFLGAPRIPRGDFEGAGNEQFARRLEDREVEEGGAPLSRQLADLCDRCREQSEETEYGDL